ncbi:hypothetical protein LTR08_006064 [Meristemomyces frigidus]|nr:hypothetical protein LTR08_006064 [Meristemomyces frigidus]
MAMPAASLGQTPTVLATRGWNAENDRKLLIYANGREIASKEYATIAARFPENPTPKAIQERLIKLRNETDQRLEEDRLSGIEANLNLLSGTDKSEDDDDNNSSPSDRRKANTKENNTDDSPKPAKTRKMQTGTSASASPIQNGLMTPTTQEKGKSTGKIDTSAVSSPQIFAIPTKRRPSSHLANQSSTSVSKSGALTGANAASAGAKTEELNRVAAMVEEEKKLLDASGTLLMLGIPVHKETEEPVEEED